MTPRRWAPAAVVCAGLVLTACSSGSHSTKPTTTTTHRTTSTTAASTTSAPASSTSTTSASTACNHVTAAAGPSQGAAGTITGVITVTNTGSAACVANGYPSVGLFSGSGAPLTVTMVNGLSVSVPPPAATAAPSPVTLAPGAAAQFTYQYSDVPTGSETSCPASEAAGVTLPGATAASPRFAFNAAPCNSGTVRVSPLYAGS